MNKEHIRHTLQLLEKKVDMSASKLQEGIDLAELSALVKQHFANEKKIDKLSSQLAAMEEQRDATWTALFDAVSKVKGKSIKLSGVCLKIQKSEILIRGKKSVSYKSVLEDLKLAIKIETKILDPIMKRHTKDAENTVDRREDLYITKESVEAKALVQFIESATGKQVVLVDKLNESWISDIGSFLLAGFKKFFGLFSQKVDKLESSIDQLLAEDKSISYTGANNGGMLESEKKNLTEDTVAGVKSYKFNGYKIELATNDKGKPVARLFRLLTAGPNKGQYKNIEGFYFPTEERRQEYIKRTMEQIKGRVADQEQRKVAKKDARANMVNPYKVGEIYYDSWGYDQTNVDFYEIIEVKDKSVVIQEIGSTGVPGTAGHDSMNVKPNPEKRGKKFLKPLVVSMYGSEPHYYIKSKHGSISKYTAGDKGVYSSWGH